MSAEIRGMPELLAKLNKLGSLAPVRAGMKAAALHVKGKAATYPPVSRRPQPFVSDKQRRGFFAKLRAGEIQVPYVRGVNPMTQRLNQSWTIDERDNGLTQIIGTAVKYARLVQDRMKQTRYHQVTGWKTAQSILANEAHEALRRVQEQIRKIIGG